MTSPIPSPARCVSCGARFQLHAPVIAFADLRLTDATGKVSEALPGPETVTFNAACPRCGGDAVIATVEVTGENGKKAWVTSTDLSVLVDIRNSLRELKDPEEAARLIEARAPALRPLSDWLRANEHLATWLTLLITIIEALMSLSAGARTPEQMTPQQVQQVITQVVEQVENGKSPRLHPQRRPGRAPARNATCPCGSGVKYKRCHGAPAP